ncbi:MAG: hypothetical protein HUU06_05005, partial [Planctomycetaceae bacterium]|nr:hypothetical protein [Planctomycetaceae bacterium]
MSLLPLRIAVAALLFAGMPAEAAPEGDAGARAAARSIVERLVEATPVWHPWERIDRANSPTRLVNEALAFAATPEGGSALRHVLAEAIGEPGEENDLKWYIRNWAADLSAFLLGRVPGKRRPEPGYEIRVIHGHAAFLRFESGYGFGGGVASPASEPSPLPDKEVRRLLLEGRTPFRPPLEPDAGSLLEDLRSETSTLGHLLEEELESGSWWEGVESSLCTGLGEAAVADAKFGRRLLAAWKGEDGRPRPTGTGERLLLLALGRWGSPEALAVLGGEARKSAAALARGEFDHDRLRLLGAAYHL